MSEAVEQTCVVRSATNPRLTLHLTRRDAPPGFLRVEIHEASIINVRPEEFLAAARTIAEPNTP